MKKIINKKSIKKSSIFNFPSTKNISSINKKYYSSNKKSSEEGYVFQDLQTYLPEVEHKFYVPKQENFEEDDYNPPPVSINYQKQVTDAITKIHQKYPERDLNDESVVSEINQEISKILSKTAMLGNKDKMPEYNKDPKAKREDFVKVKRDI